MLHSFLYDETAVVGIKPYEKESFRQIHWKATAKMQSMYDKHYQPITNKRYTILLYITEPKEGVFKLPLNTCINHLQMTLEKLAIIQNDLPFMRENYFLSIAKETLDQSHEMIYINGEQPPNINAGTSYLYMGEEGELRRVGGKAKVSD